MSLFYLYTCNLKDDNLQGEVCLAFADEVLGWLYRTVEESKIMNFVH